MSTFTKGKFPSKTAEKVYDYVQAGDFTECLGNVQGFGFFALVDTDENRLYILSEDNQGFVEVTYFPTLAKALSAWNDLEAAYETWLRQGGDPYDDEGEW